MPELYGWGSNVHGQLARPLRDVCAREIVHIAPASAILAVSATQVVFRDHDQAFVLGVTRTKAMGRAIGQDEILAYLNRGHVYFPDGTRAEARCTWRDAAADLTGRILALSERGDPWLFSTVGAWLASDGTEKTKGMLLSAHGAQTAPAFRRVDAGVRTKDGDCYGWGWIPDADGAIQPPFLLDLPTDVAAVACGASNTYFLLTDNTLWGIGSNEHGELGPNAAPLAWHTELQRIELAGAVRHVAASQWTCYALVNE
ncbi:uncharacterized protein MJAP1_002472 [Malassezia japonica]|uniref:Uncharacterized protein n=1 Tax=Malassezia japonica TaxID=223818 RepID=A0AAF0JAS6_9BASI|nr:uncharacterized protein MJAP1_002472 [Malassezia japonica]WFD39495.1 hypothetical protein MJAP1_002472 [Malassezia japonica]